MACKFWRAPIRTWRISSSAADRRPCGNAAAGFPTLVHIILEQQVSLASARAAFDRLQTAVSPLTPEGFLTLDDVRLKQIGFSRQKTGYARHLARAILAGELDLPGLQDLDDAAARAALLKMKGIGPWSADIYLLMVLRRPDVWPAGDLALAIATQEVNGSRPYPGPTSLRRSANGGARGAR